MDFCVNHPDNNSRRKNYFALKQYPPCGKWRSVYSGDRLSTVRPTLGPRGVLKTREWKTLDREKYGGGKRRTGKLGTKFHEWKKQERVIDKYKCIICTDKKHSSQAKKLLISITKCKVLCLNDITN